MLYAITNLNLPPPPTLPLYPSRPFLTHMVLHTPLPLPSLLISPFTLISRIPPFILLPCNLIIPSTINPFPLLLFHLFYHLKPLSFHLFYHLKPHLPLHLFYPRKPLLPYPISHSTCFIFLKPSPSLLTLHLFYPLKPLLPYPISHSTCFIFFKPSSFLHPFHLFFPLKPLLPSPISHTTCFIFSKASSFPPTSHSTCLIVLKASPLLSSIPLVLSSTLLWYSFSHSSLSY